MTASPLFSVIVPTFNRQLLLERAVTSILTQTLQDFEVIVVDDGSPEPRTPSCAADPRVHFVRSTENRGAAHARNLGLERARGRYVSFLDDDDEYAPNFLAATHAALRDSPAAVGASWCDVEFVDDIRAETVASRKFPAEYPSLRAQLADFLTIGVGFGVTLKAECLKAVGHFDTSLAVTEDDDLFFRIVAKGFHPVVVRQTRVLVHQHGGTRLTGTHLYERRINEARRLLETYAPLLTSYPEIRQQVVNNIEYLEAQRPRAAAP